MDEWRIESLWGMRGLRALKTGLEAARARTPRTLNSLQGAEAESPGAADAAEVARTLARDRRRLEDQERTILHQQARLLAARQQLKSVKLTNLAIQEGRRALLAERTQRQEGAREAAFLQRRTMAGTARRRSPQ